MKKIICLVVTLLMTLPAYAKLTAHEEARINAMLEGLAQKKDLIFVRNGDEHTCDEAVSHLRLKLGNTRNRIDTAEQFIDKVASSSQSVTAATGFRHESSRKPPIPRQTRQSRGRWSAPRRKAAPSGCSAA